MQIKHEIQKVIPLLRYKSCSKLLKHKRLKMVKLTLKILQHLLQDF